MLGPDGGGVTTFSHRDMPMAQMAAVAGPGMGAAAMESLRSAMPRMVPTKFSQLSDLPPPMAFLVACGAANDINQARKTLDEHHDAALRDVTQLRLPGAGFTALDWAARKGNFEIAQWLATDARTRGLTRTGAPIGWACYTNHVELAKMLVGYGADVHATDVVFWTHAHALMAAAENGQLLAIKWLVEEQGVDIRMESRPGRGILAAINRARFQGQETLPAGHVACAHFAREKGATC